ncbi:MAG: vancomycin resistance protein VanJ [Alteromonadaceae bacterium]|jgi:vancomycin resistance protein VanJ
MQKYTKNSMRKCITLLFSFGFLASIIVFTLPIWSKLDLLLIPEHLVIFAPRWWLITLILILSMFWRYLTLYQRYTLPLLFYISLVYLDFQLPNRADVPAGKSTIFKVVTVNMGEGSQLAKLKQVIKYYRPDILVLQEIRIKSLKSLNTNYTYTDCEGSLCLLSKFPFERTVSLNRSILNGLGNFAMSYQITINGHQINLSNIHLETPREVLLDVIKSRELSYGAKIKAENRQLEAAIFGDSIKDKANLVIAGDFNMPDDDPIYEKNFAWLSNALNESGFGFNNTKYTHWKGIPFFSLRIDHILYSENITAKSVEVLDFLGGDHRPVMATLEVFN